MKLQKLKARHHGLLVIKDRIESPRFKGGLTSKLRIQTISKVYFLLTLRKLADPHHELLLMKARMEARSFKRGLIWKLRIQTIGKV